MLTADELRAKAAEGAGRAKPNGEGEPPQPLIIAPVSTWAGRTPPPRDWFWENWIPAGRVTILGGDGGVCKSLLSQTLATASGARLRTLYGAPISSGVGLGLFSEEEQDELERRQIAICESLGVDESTLEDLHLLSRFGEDNLLATYVGGIAVPTPFYWRLDATCALLRPRLLILDPVADFFGGNPIFQGEVRQFVQVILGGFCLRYGTSVLIPMHPSATGVSSGEGAGFSVAWSNSARSRLYMEHAKDAEPTSGRFALSRKKSNYSARGGELDLVYDRGALITESATTGGLVASIRERAARKAILRLLAQCETIGRSVPYSPNANQNAALLLGELPGYPTQFKGKGKSDLFALLRRLEADRAICKGEEKNNSRHPTNVWQLTESGRAETGEDAT